MGHCRPLIGKPRHDGGGRSAIDLHHFMPPGVTADQVHLAAWTIQGVRQQTNQGFVGGGVHGRRGDFDAQLGAQRLADLVLRGAGLEFDGERDAVGLSRDESGEFLRSPFRFVSASVHGSARTGAGLVFPVVHSPVTLPESLPR